MRSMLFLIRIMKFFYYRLDVMGLFSKNECFEIDLFIRNTLSIKSLTSISDGPIKRFKTF